jgi:hypothetical protein
MKLEMERNKFLTHAEQIEVHTTTKDIKVYSLADYSKLTIDQDKVK